jgi:tetratricopeptide (TPR) repeat protein
MTSARAGHVTDSERQRQPDAAPGGGSRTLWVDRPWTDLLIGCGGWSAPLLLLAYGLAGSDARRWSALFYGLALVCNYPHYMATIHRAYARPEDRARYRLFTHYVTGLLLLLAVAALFSPLLLSIVFTTYVMWSPWHYTGQNFGLAMMFLRRGGVAVAPRDRLYLRTAFIASFVMLLAAFNQGASSDPLVLSLGLPDAIARGLQIAAGALFLGAGLLALRAFAARADGWRTMIPSTTLYVTQACWFVIPVALTWASSVPAPQTRYSSGILAVMHSAQYLWITRHYARRDAARHGQAPAAWNGWAYWGTLIVGGVALFLPGPWIASYAGHFDFTSSMLIATAVVNIHHFILDGVVWKLRDPRVAQALVDSGLNAAPSPTLDTAARPARASSGWRVVAALRPALKPIAIAILLVLAAVDQWRYTLALRDADRGALETASLLNPYDSSVQMKRASVARRSGDQASAERALRQAMAANPHDPAAWRSLERLLIESDRLPEAYAHSRALLARWPRDVDTLVNAGVLAYRLGEVSAAEDWWRRALEQDASLLQVHLYLAELLDEASRTAEAVPHYQRYLEIVARAPRERQVTAPRQVALVVVKFADALSRTGQRDVAATQYDLALRIARQTGLQDVEALVAERRAVNLPYSQ